MQLKSNRYAIFIVLELSVSSFINYLEQSALAVHKLFGAGHNQVQ